MHISTDCLQEELFMHPSLQNEKEEETKISRLKQNCGSFVFALADILFFTALPDSTTHTHSGVCVLSLQSLISPWNQILESGEITEKSRLNRKTTRRRELDTRPEVRLSCSPCMLGKHARDFTRLPLTLTSRGDCRELRIRRRRIRLHHRSYDWTFCQQQLFACLGN